MQPANPILTSKKGFTLIELLVVVAILGILATIAFAMLNPAVLFGQAKDVRRKSDLREIAKAIQLYYGDNKKYPTAASFTSVATLFGSSGTYPLVPSYIKAVPTDPVNSGGNVYMYKSNGAVGTCGTDQDYALKVVLQRTNDPQAYSTTAVPNWCGVATSVEGGSTPATGSYYVSPN